MAQYDSYYYPNRRLHSSQLEATSTVVSLVDEAHPKRKWANGLALILVTLFAGTTVVSASALRVHNNVASLQHQTASTPPPAAVTTEPKPPTNPEVPAVDPIAPAKPTAPSSAELQTVLNTWQGNYKKSSFGVVVKELGGDNRSASLNADTQFEAASLYKLYLTDYLYTKIDKGAFKTTSSIGGSQNLDTCIRLMITISDNTCGESIGYGLGWLALDNFVRASGYTKTAISSYNVTSANDTATFLEKLEGGQLLSAEHRATLLGYMSQQIYRSAIPAGAPGIKVVDKVGFTPNNWNDAAIVYHPKGTYVLVVLSKDAGTDPIKDLSARVSAFMNR